MSADRDTAHGEGDELVCGESFDHDERITFEDDTGYQWKCLRCGAEGWEDMDDPEAAS